MEATLELGNGHRLEEYGGFRKRLKNEGKFGTSLLNGCDQHDDNDMDNEVQAEEVSDGNNKIIGNGSKGHFYYALAKNLAALCPCIRDLWNFELESDGFGYLEKKIF